MKPEVTISSKMVYKGFAANVRVDTVRKPNGKVTERTIVEHADCIAVVAVDNDDNILLVRQFRKPVEKELLEITAGGIDPGEDVETAVRREMQEETGYLPQKLVRLGGIYSAPGYNTEYLHVFVATDLVPSRLVAEDTEGIDVVRFTVTEIRKMLSCGEFCDAKTVAGLYMYLDWRERQRS